MTAFESFRDKIMSLCKDSEYAMALFLRASIPDWRYEDILRNADLYGLDKKKLNEALNIINSLEKSANSIIEFDKIMKEVVSECVEKFSAELENISRKRIENLQGPEINALRYASYIIKWLSPYKGKIYELSFTDKDILIESLCATLQVDCDSAKKFAEILAKIGITFYHYDASRRHNFYIYTVPPYAVKIIDELAKELEDKLKKSIEMIRNLNNTKFLSALLIALRDEDFFIYNPGIFEAVYGVRWYEYLGTIKFQDICYYGYVNYSISNLICNVIIELAKSRFDKIYKAIEKALKEKGFEIIEINEPKLDEYNVCRTDIYYTILAVKQEQYRVAIHILPFPYKLPRERAEREVIVIEGPIARPEVIAKGRNYVIVEMDKNFERAINVFDYVNEDWGKEIAEVFKSLDIIKSSPPIITSPSQPLPISVPSTTSSSSTSAPISSASLSDKDILAKIKSIQAKDILEAVVATLLQDLGFEVKVDAQIPAKDGVPREVDVWACKTVSGVDFCIYVSCKNLNSDIGTPIIDQESGRVNKLQKTPNMKFIVASKFNDQAKKTARFDGFILIEIGSKVDESNAVDAYKKVYEFMKVMNEIFAAKETKSLQQLAEVISKVSEGLRKISDELSKLASGSQPNI